MKKFLIQLLPEELRELEEYARVEHGGSENYRKAAALLVLESLRRWERERAVGGGASEL